jgi:hypothetical protein
MPVLQIVLLAWGGEGLFRPSLVGPLFSIESLGSYLGDHLTVSYVIKNLRLDTHLAWDLPGVF